MLEKDKTANGEPGDSTDGERCEEIDSRFRLVVVASLRSKQLLRGSRPRIEADTKRRRNTSIALEEVRRGLVNFMITDEEHNDNDGEEQRDQD